MVVEVPVSSVRSLAPAGERFEVKWSAIGEDEYPRSVFLVPAVNLRVRGLAIRRPDTVLVSLPLGVAPENAGLADDHHIRGGGSFRTVAQETDTQKTEAGDERRFHNDSRFAGIRSSRRYCSELKIAEANPFLKPSEISVAILLKWGKRQANLMGVGSPAFGCGLRDRPLRSRRLKEAAPVLWVSTQDEAWLKVVPALLPQIPKRIIGKILNVFP